VIVLDGSGLRTEQIVAVAHEGEPVALAPAAIARNAGARETIAALLQSGEALYGASTGVGALRDHRVAESERERLQWNLLRSHAVTAGEPLTREQVRAAMTVRANQLGAGGAGVVEGLLTGLVRALNDGITPLTGSLGAIGTGDLGTLAEIALALLGEGHAWVEGELLPAPAVCGPVTLGLRDALGFISSNATTLGWAALVWSDARTLQDAWLATAALSFEAVGADPRVFDRAVQAGRGSPDQAAVAARMRELLDGYARPVRDSPLPVQDPYPFRVLGPVDGVPHGAMAALEEVIAREANSRSENALIDDCSAWPNGNFHGAELAAAVDRVRAALAQSASLIAARVSTLLDPRFTGLPQFLALAPGTDSGAMIVEYLALDAAAEVRSLADTVATQSVTASTGVESHASMSATSVRRAEQQLDPLRVLVACELVLALRAMRLAARAPSGAGARRLYAAASALPTELADRTLSPDIEAACDVLRRWRIA
jgi:histidine ammonia-lyase